MYLNTTIGAIIMPIFTPVSVGIKISGVSANCGNSTIGERATANIVSLLNGDGPAVVVINCQEVHYTRQVEQLQRAIASNPNLQLVRSDLMVTRTKFDREVMAGRTGIATFVLYDKTKVGSVAFDPSKAREVRGENKNKGGYLNTLVIKALGSAAQVQVRTISGHLDSNSEKKRADDWRNIKKNNAFEAATWTELVAKIPVVQIAGYDANTRNLWDKETHSASNPWVSNPLHPGVAPMALSPLGTQRYSSANTYNVIEDSPMTADKKRPGYAKGGALDFVTIQNNSAFPGSTLRPRGYKEAAFNLGLEPGTGRDHTVIVSPPTTIQAVSEFDHVRRYIYAELMIAAPRLARDLEDLEDNVGNRDILLALHRYYLRPEGELHKNIASVASHSTAMVNPWFRSRTLKSFRVEDFERRIDAFNSCVDGIKKSFNPNRLLYTKTQYLFPNALFNRESKAYLHGIAHNAPLTTMVDMKRRLDAALNALGSVTHDPRKKAKISEFQAALGLVHAAVSFNFEEAHSDTASDISVAESSTILSSSGSSLRRLVTSSSDTSEPTRTNPSPELSLDIRYKEMIRGSQKPSGDEDRPELKLPS